MLVVGAHLGALFIPLVERLEPIADWPQLGQVFLISAPAHETPPLSPALDRAPLAKVIADSWPELAPLPLPSESAPTGSALAPPDWKQSGEDAAADAAQDHYRALGPRPEEPPVKQSPSPFAPPPRHKYGEVDVDDQKNPILWLSEHCWLRPRNLRAEPGDPFANVSMTFCSAPFGKKEPRGDLFEHLRKTPPVP